MSELPTSPAASFRSTPRAVLVADLVGSTRLYERLGDRTARRLVAASLEAMTSAVREHEGRLIKSLGDGILACFPGAEALEAAKDMVERLTLELRVGIHYGEVIDDGEDIFGDAVNTAARIAALAKGAEILVSRPMWEILPASVQTRMRQVPPISVKGKGRPLELFASLREAADEPSDLATLAASIRQVAREAVLELQYGDQALSFRGDDEIRLGRGGRCDIRLRNDRASRVHATITHRPPNFLLENESTNGTFLVPDGQEKIHLLRRGTLLSGSGKIYAGSDPDATPTEPVLYRVFVAGAGSPGGQVETRGH